MHIIIRCVGCLGRLIVILYNVSRISRAPTDPCCWKGQAAHRKALERWPHSPPELTVGLASALQFYQSQHFSLSLINTVLQWAVQQTYTYTHIHMHSHNCKGNSHNYRLLQIKKMLIWRERVHARELNGFARANRLLCSPKWMAAFAFFTKDQPEYYSDDWLLIVLENWPTAELKIGALILTNDLFDWILASKARVAN